jgi:hypothetical protein
VLWIRGPVSIIIEWTGFSLFWVAIVGVILDFRYFTTAV